MQNTDLKLCSSKLIFKPNLEKVTEEILKLIDENNVLDLTALFQLITRYKLSNVVIPDELDIKEIKTSKCELSKHIEAYIELPTLHIKSLDLKLKDTVYIKELNFERCTIDEIAEGGLSNLSSDKVLFNPANKIVLQGISLTNTHIKYTNLKPSVLEPFSLSKEGVNGINLSNVKEFKGFSLYGVNSINELKLDLDNSVYEESIGKNIKDIYLPVSKEFYLKSLEKFMVRCNKLLHKKDHKKLTTSEYTEMVDFFQYYAQNEIDFTDEESPDDYNLFSNGGYTPIKYSKLKDINRHGILLWLSILICKGEMTVTEEEYKESLLNSLYKIFIVSDKDTERKVYLYNAEKGGTNNPFNKNEYKLYLSGTDESRGRVEIYTDETVTGLLASKSFNYYKPDENLSKTEERSNG